jgi:hypothetical protein
MRDATASPKLLAGLLVILLFEVSSAVPMVLVSGPTIQPPDAIASRFDRLAGRLENKKPAYACYAVSDGSQSANCMLKLPCTFATASYQADRFVNTGINFANEEPSQTFVCNTQLFLSQIASLLEILFDVPAERASEIVETMDREERRFGSCAPSQLGSVDEGSGCLNYGRDGLKYRDRNGHEMLGETMHPKIFVWVRN